jgi:hypothetical protein
VNTLLAAAVITKYDVLPNDVTIPIMLSQGAVAIGGIASYLSGKEMRIQATKEGKSVMRDGKTGAGLHMLSKALEQSNKTKLSKMAMFGASILYNFSSSNVPKVAIDYSNRLLDHHDE